MDLRIVRYDITPDRTIGRLTVNGQSGYFTLEDYQHDGPKIPGHTAIPLGRYAIGLTPSQRFKRVLPILLNVPGFAGIRLHPGNTAEDTEGCILVGRIRSVDSIHESAAAMHELQMQMGATMGTGEEVWLTIEAALPEGTLLA